MDKIKSAFKASRQPVIVTLVLLIICGLLFPLVLTGLSSIIFPAQAAGSLIEADGKIVGSKFVGQDFTKPYFMKCRPSAVNYNTFDKIDKDSVPASGSNNYGPSNKELQKRVEADIESFLKSNPGVKREDIPTDLMTASGSGLDPHISPKAAYIQLDAIEKASGISKENLERIVENNTEGKLLSIFGEERVNVLGVNLEIAKEMGII